MNSVHVKTAAALLCWAVLLFGQAQETRVSIGVLNLAAGANDAELVSKATSLVESYLKEIGLYTVSSQSDLEKTFESIQKKFPRSAKDPRAVIEIGSTCRLERMIYGSIDHNQASYGVVLYLIDVLRRQTIEEVKLESAKGVALDDLLKVAVNKLHGRVDDQAMAKVQTYYGPEVHNEKEVAISSGSTVGLALVWALANGSLYGKDANSYSPIVVDQELSGDLSGLATSADHIPLFGRPSALANAYVAESDDAYGVLYNPAGSAWVLSRGAALGYQYRYGLNLFAASYVNKATREIGYGHAFIYCGDSANLLNEAYFISGISYKFNRLVSFLRPFSLGADLKIASVSTGKKQSPSASSGNSFGLWMDLGLKWELTSQISYGLVFRDLPLISMWHNTATDESYYEAQPPQMLMGGTFQAGYSTFLIAEGQIPLYSDQTWQMAGGVEQEMFKIIRARVGVRKEIMSDIATPWLVTGGIGVNVPTDQWFGQNLNVDASYGFNQFGPFSNVVNFSFMFDF